VGQGQSEIPRGGPGAPREALSRTGTKLNASSGVGAEPAALGLGKGHKEPLEQGRSKSRHPVWGRGKMILCKAATGETESSQERCDERSHPSKAVAKLDVSSKT